MEHRPCWPGLVEGSETIRLTVFRTANVHVDVKVRSGGWFAEVRVWRGSRWPTLEASYLAAIRHWVPWFSLRRQVLRAVERVNQFEDLHLTRHEVLDKVAVALLLISEETSHTGR